MLGPPRSRTNGSLCTAPDFPGRMAAIRERGGRIVTVSCGAARRPPTLPTNTCPSGPAPTPCGWRPWSPRSSRPAWSIRATWPTSSTWVDQTLAALAPFTLDSVAAHTGAGRGHPSHRPRTGPGPHRRRVRAHRHAHHPVRHVGVVAGRGAQRDHGQPRPSGAVAPCSPSPPTALPGNCRAAPWSGLQRGPMALAVGDHPEVRGEMPVAALAGEDQTPGPGQVKALITSGGNPAQVVPRQRAPRCRAGAGWTSWSRSTSTQTRPPATPT